MPGDGDGDSDSDSDGDGDEDEDDILKAYDERQGQPPLFAVSHFIIWCKHHQFHHNLTIP